MSIGTLLKEIRIKSNLSQRDVSEALGYTTAQFVSNWERETFRIHPPSDIKKLAQVLKFDSKQLATLVKEGMVDDYKRKLDSKFKKVLGL